ncbi:MAG: hypothetical protein O6761_07975 [Thaumarchaeota archaeon]|nr:hypothetical protein [Nitrososphaerota archaeon]
MKKGAAIVIGVAVAVVIAIGAMVSMSSNEDIVNNSETQIPDIVTEETDVVTEETTPTVGRNLTITLRETVGVSDEP